jgi:hypothetical protein
MLVFNPNHRPIINTINVYKILINKATAQVKQSSPATRHGDAWGERMYSSYSLLTSAIDGGEWSAPRLGRALPRGRDHRYALYRRLGGPQSR